MGSTTRSLRISWNDNILSIQGTGLSSDRVDVNYLEAFCRAGFHDREWKDTLIRHMTILLSGDAGGTRLHLETELSDGCVVSHVITSGGDEIDFHVTAHNPTDHKSEVHWAQPCIRLLDLRTPRIHTSTSGDASFSLRLNLTECLLPAGTGRRVTPPDKCGVRVMSPGQMSIPAP